MRNWAWTGTLRLSAVACSSPLACQALSRPAPLRQVRRRRSGGQGVLHGYQSRLWKKELMALAGETGLEITVCHLPPGTSKWNKIEHRLFAHITMLAGGSR